MEGYDGGPPDGDYTEPAGTPREPMKFTHVDDWLAEPRLWGKDEAYAAFFLEYARMPAHKRGRYHHVMKDYKVFCTWRGKRYRLTGASRMGDVWLTSNFEQDVGYEHRVEITECSEWGRKP